MIELLVSSEIYSDESIQRAILAYKDYAKIRVSRKEKYMLLRFSNCKYNERETALAFENYMIGVENSRT